MSMLHVTDRGVVYASAITTAKVKEGYMIPIDPVTDMCTSQIQQLALTTYGRPAVWVQRDAGDARLGVMRNGRVFRVAVVGEAGVSWQPDVVGYVTVGGHTPFGLCPHCSGLSQVDCLTCDRGSVADTDELGISWWDTASGALAIC